MAVARCRPADSLGNARALAARLIGQDLDFRAFARAQQARPVGFHFAPEPLLLRLAAEGALGAEAVDQGFLLDLVERLANGSARHAAFCGEIIHRRDLLAGLPHTLLDPAPEKRGELDVTRDRTPIQIQCRCTGCPDRGPRRAVHLSTSLDSAPGSA